MSFQNKKKIIYLHISEFYSLQLLDEDCHPDKSITTKTKSEVDKKQLRHMNALKYVKDVTPNSHQVLVDNNLD